MDFLGPFRGRLPCQIPQAATRAADVAKQVLRRQIDFEVCASDGFDSEVWGPIVGLKWYSYSHSIYSGSNIRDSYFFGLWTIFILDIHMNIDMVILLYIHMNMSGNMDMGPLHSSVVCDVSSSLETSTARMRRSSGSSCWRAWSTTSSGQQLTRRTDSHGVSRELPWSPHPLGKIRINQTCFFFLWRPSELVHWVCLPAPSASAFCVGARSTAFYAGSRLKLSWVPARNLWRPSWSRICRTPSTRSLGEL